jgi:NAD(P)-dependent dehydrogenase (short-subunit alcohol dehydrogenase family)
MNTLVLSGVSRGIGAGVARSFLAQGWQVHGLGRSATPDLLGFSEFYFHPCDMRDANGVVEACAALPAAVDVILCNAATFGGEAFYCDNFDDGEWAEALAVNLLAPAIIARELKSRLLAGSRRMLVMMSTGNASLAGNADGTMLAYRTSKSALNQLVRCLAAEWGPQGIVAVALNPGWVKTDMGGLNAPMSVDDAAKEIYSFVNDVASEALNGFFVNPDGSSLPW